MNKPELTGIVNLEDLPGKEVYICLNREFFIELNKKIRFLGIYKLSREINENKRILNHWLSDGTLIRLDVLLNVLNYFGYENWQNKILFLRGKTGGKIYIPKLPFNFKTQSGVRLIASILGDGGLSNKGDIIYSNTNPLLINDFISDLNNIFGNVEHYICGYSRKNSVIKVVYPPQFLRHIFNLFNICMGKKVVNNPTIPHFIYELPPKIRFDFISKIIDDEGTVNIKARHISIVSCTEENHFSSNLLDGIKDLLLIEGINCNIYTEKPYFSTRGLNRIKRRLQINNYFQLEKLSNELRIKSKNKSDNLKFLLNSYKRYKREENIIF